MCRVYGRLRKSRNNAPIIWGKKKKKKWSYWVPKTPNPPKRIPRRNPKIAGLYLSRRKFTANDPKAVKTTKKSL